MFCTSDMVEYFSTIKKMQTAAKKCEKLSQFILLYSAYIIPPDESNIGLNAYELPYLKQEVQSLCKDYPVY